jgi:hypothetical protein
MWKSNLTKENEMATAKRKSSKSNAAKIRADMIENPNAKPAYVAEKFNARPAYVYVLRSQMKKQGEGAKPVVFSSNKSITELMPALTQAEDVVNHPAHYKTGGIETIDFIEAKRLNYRLGNVVKYITRADHKGDRLENLKKAQWYLEREIASS